jgi:hypothetical protein
MKQSRTKQGGFGAVEIVVICLVVVVLGAVGFTVFRQTHNTKANTTTSTEEEQPAQQTAQTNAEPAQTAQQYLVIKEWGVQLPLPDSVKDAYYVPDVNSKGTDGITNQIYIGLKSLDSSGCQAGGNLQGKDTAIAVIVRGLPSEKDPVSGNVITKDFPDGITIGKFYYGYLWLKNNKCNAPSSSIQTADSTFKSSIKELAPTTATAN